MVSKKKPSKSKVFRDIRFVFPSEIADLFCAEAKKQRRKYSAHLTLILEERYQPKENTND